MKTVYTKFITALALTTTFVTPMARAEIPFSQARGMLMNTQEGKKDFSPFWAMVAVHGKMLETIRFFGNYATAPNTEAAQDDAENIRTVDQGRDPIAKLIRALFNSPDGVQFVATTYEASPVGNLSRNLKKINDIIEILVDDRKNKDKKTNDISSVLNTIIPTKLSPEKIEKLMKQDISDQVAKQQTEFVKNEIDTAKQEEQILLQANMENIRTELNQQAYEQIVTLAKQKGIAVKEGMPTGARNALIKKIEAHFNAPQYSPESLTTLTDDQLREIASQNPNIDFKENWQEKAKKDLIDKIIKKMDAESKTEITSNIKNSLRQFAQTHNLNFDETFSKADLTKSFVSDLTRFKTEESFKNLTRNMSLNASIELAKQQMGAENRKFATLIVEAYEGQKIHANPEAKPNKYLYPKNIVVTALLSFFVKVADDKEELEKLPFLMNPGGIKQPDFDAKEYSALKQDLGSNLPPEQLLIDSELAFLMAKGYDAYESPYINPINYRHAPYENTTFPDCGETSLRNVLGILLSAGNGGIVQTDVLKGLRTKLQELNPSIQLRSKLFEQMLHFFETNTDMTMGATEKVHGEWAMVVSNLNNGQAPQTLNTVQYGRRIAINDSNTYEIKSAAHPEVRGIVNMFNVIAKLIPDQVLNKQWSPDRGQRLKQVSTKLDRLCELLSREGLDLSWKNDMTNDKNITDEILSIVFMNNSSPIFVWHFISGHFQLGLLSTPMNDWRVPYQTVDEKLFPNEWMASLYLKLNPDKFLSDKDYGVTYPLSLLFNPALRGIDGAMNALAFVLKDDRTSQFLPLMPRWIDKSVPLNDPYALDNISLLLLAEYKHDSVKEILKYQKYGAIKKRVEQALSDPSLLLKNDSMRKTFKLTAPGILELKNIPTWLNKEDLRALTNIQSWDLSAIYANRINNEDLQYFPNLKNLNLSTYNKSSNKHDITDKGLNNLTNLVNLNLESNKIITDEGLKNLTNLQRLNLLSDEKITDEGLMNLKNLRSLNLAKNNKITDEGLKELTNLRDLDLQLNTKITNQGLSNLTNLETLNLGDNKTITNDGLKKIPNLQKLDLSNNITITDDGLVNLKNLQNLVLWFNTTITDEELLTLQNLQSVDLSYNTKISADGIAKLKQRNPNIKIIGR